MELTQEYLDQQFSKLATKEDLYLMATAEEQKQISQTVEAIKTSIDGNTTTLDGIAKGLQDLRIEKVSRQSQLDRHAKWIKAIADHVGVKLEN
jgi:hypothetical protein